MKHVRTEIGFGDDSTKKTIEKMIKLAVRDSKSDIIKNIAQKLKSKAKDENSLILSIFDFVKDNVEYRSDLEGAKELLKLKGDNAERTELLIAPIHLLTKVKQGDCDDMSMAIASICLALNIPVNYKIIAWRIDAYTHVYNEVGFTKTFKKPYWIPCDVVIGKFGKEKEGIKRYETFRVQ